MKIRENKAAYRRKVEQKLEDNSIKEVWSGMKNITYNRYNVASQTADGDRARADDFNLFF